MYLDNQWYISTQGKHGPFYSVEKDEFKNLNSYVKNKKGYVWLKTYFYLPESLKGSSLSCYLGIIKIANETYLNGSLIGTYGHFPPNEFSVGELVTTYNLPNSLLHYNSEKNELLIKIWVNNWGCMSINPYISTEEIVTFHKYKTEFLSSKIFLLFSFITIIIAAIYFLLYLFRRTDKNHRSFALLTFFTAFFLLSVDLGEYPIIFKTGFSYLLFVQLFYGGAASLTGYFAVSFIRDFLDMKDSKKRIIYRLSLTLLSFILIFSAKDLVSIAKTLLYVFILMTIHILYAVVIIVRAIISHNKKVFSLLLGFSPVLVSLLIAIGVLVFNFDTSPLLVIAIGWMSTILSFLGILIYNLSISQTQAEYLNKNLEKIVRQRTSELEDSNILLADKNSELQFEKERTLKEIELASFVQQSFFDQRLPEINGWQISYFLKPLAGVSGDLYDVFHNGNELQGLGVFDVSGHGISSGLVTMLVKNIIEQEFYAGKEEKLEDVMYIINDRVIEEKGNIENYLTGILVRIKENQIEYVNAGHPPTLLFRQDKKNPEFINTDRKQCGVIGIADFPINFETVSVDIRRGDTLLFYTDGITESMNEKREEFGKKRLYDAFLKYKDLSLDDQIKSIVNEVYTFHGKESLEDDITLLMLKKL